MLFTTTILEVLAHILESFITDPEADFVRVADYQVNTTTKSVVKNVTANILTTKDKKKKSMAPRMSEYAVLTRERRKDPKYRYRENAKRNE